MQGYKDRWRKMNDQIMQRALTWAPGNWGFEGTQIIILKWAFTVTFNGLFCDVELFRKNIQRRFLETAPNIFLGFN